MCTTSCIQGGRHRERSVYDERHCLLSSRAGSDVSHSNFSFVAGKMGCGGDRNASEELACMRKVPAKKIVEFVGRYNDGNNGSMPSLSFGPVPDGKVVFSNYTQRYINGARIRELQRLSRTAQTKVLA